jgi:predicted metal-dependent phosphoesterase TrpH
MGYLLGLAAVIIVAVIMAASADKKSKSTPIAVRPLSERSPEELKQNLHQAETDVEMRKIEYQGAISNPYASHIVRDLSKKNLESAIARKAMIVAEIERRKAGAS